jgi:Calcium binding
MSKFDKPKFEKPKLVKPKLDEGQTQDKSLPSIAELHPIQLDETIVAGRRSKQQSDLARLLLEMPDFGSIDPRMSIGTSEALGFNLKQVASKVKKVLHPNSIEVGVKNTIKYLEYLKQNMIVPCRVTGREEFRWEEEYLSDFGNKKEYEKLKKTQPSYTEIFQILRLRDSVSKQDGVMVDVQRLTDKQIFILPLVALEPIDKSSPNNQLLEDYTLWFINF